MIMEALYLVWSLTLLINCNFCCCERLEPGIFNITLNMLNEANRFGVVTKNLANETDIAITVDCVGEGKYTIEWIVGYTECNVLHFANETQYLERLFDSGGNFEITNEEDYILVQRSNASNEMDCQHDLQYLQDESGPDSFTCYPKNDVEHCKFQGGSPTLKTKPNTQLTKPLLKRSPDELTSEPPTETPTELPNGRVTRIPQPGRYWVVVRLTPRPLLPTKLQVTLTINMRNPSGYLSAFQAPLLPFYAVMCGFYSVLLIIWLVLLSLQWQNLLGIQFWIGGVMLLGLLVMAISCALFKTVDDYGVAMPGAAVVAELISCSKRSVARMLTLSVSLGHGVTRQAGIAEL
ncbi:transmembrane protein 87A-like isoform X2 [Patiria miniata]|uniref:GOST seven transmembrane domain-containing protein n=1 Tax=Patiria miniata TaxID=46514 RepID=A0A914AS52_PATMI|nr:transmembrane protein 87A-like isoform X2 [Patiria miniata]